MYGPPGTGKSLMAKAVSNETDANLFMLTPSGINRRYHGETETIIAAVFAAVSALIIVFFMLSNYVKIVRKSVKALDKKFNVSVLVTNHKLLLVLLHLYTHCPVHLSTNGLNIAHQNNNLLFKDMLYLFLYPKSPVTKHL